MFDVEEHGALSSCTLVCVFAAVDGSRRITPSSLQRQRALPRVRKGIRRRTDVGA